MKKRINKGIVILLLLILTVPVISQVEEAYEGYIPTNGFVPDEDTAIAIALAVWKPVYGDKIKSSRHYEAVLENGIWYISEKVSYGLFSSSGGELYMEIDKETGQILKMYCTK
ncbi:MAG: hypothetical protein KBT02_09415 [Treponema sp.]|nr:hypothetical protein [Candidatus Treponema caballi]